MLNELQLFVWLVCLWVGVDTAVGFLLTCSACSSCTAEFIAVVWFFAVQTLALLASRRAQGGPAIDTWL